MSTDHDQCLDVFVKGIQDDAEKYLEKIGDPLELPQLKGKNERNLLHLAAQWGWLDIVDTLLVKYKFNVASTDDEGFTTLHAACGNGDLTVVKRLLREENCDPMCASKKR